MALLLEETANYKIENGVYSLSDVELLALLIAGEDETSLEKARKILSTTSIRGIGRLSLEDFNALGLSHKESARIVAAVEMSRRKQLSDLEKRPQISNSKDCYNLVGPLIEDLQIEEFWVVFVNRQNEVLGKKRMSVGGTGGTVVDIKLIFKAAIEKCAAGVILFHNHPSGSLQPSGADIELTKRVAASGKMLEITLLDHLIVSEKGYYSFADESMF